MTVVPVRSICFEALSTAAGCLAATRRFPMHVGSAHAFSICACCICVKLKNMVSRDFMGCHPPFKGALGRIRMLAQQEITRLAVLYAAVIVWAVLCMKSTLPRRPLRIGPSGARQYRILHNVLFGIGAFFSMSLILTGQAYLFLFLGASAVVTFGLYGMQEGSFVGKCLEKAATLVQGQCDSWLVTDASQTTIRLPSQAGVFLPPTIENSLVNLLQHAINKNAESIHLQPSSQNAARVFFMVNGARKRFATIEKTAVGQFVDILEGWKLPGIAQHQVAGCGWLRFPTEAAGQLFAYQSRQTSRGTKLNLRACAGSEEIVREGIPSLGLDEEQLNTIRQYLSRPSGMLIVCGPSRSGKSTTGIAMVAEKVAAGKRVNVLQNSPGLVLANTKTYVTTPEAGNTAAEHISELRRQGAGVLLVDGVDKKADLVAAVEAAALDQLLVATIPNVQTEHIFNSLATQFTDRILVETSVTVIVEQRLISRLCSACRRKAVLSYADRVALGIEKTDGNPPVGYVPVGCSACKGSGYQGRIGVFTVAECGPLWKKWHKRSTRTSLVKELREWKLRQFRTEVAQKVLKGVCAAADARESLEAGALA